MRECINRATLRFWKPAEALRIALRDAGSQTEVLAGAAAALETIAAHPDADAVMAAIVGAAGLPARSRLRVRARPCCSPTRKRW